MSVIPKEVIEALYELKKKYGINKYRRPKEVDGCLADYICNYTRERKILSRIGAAGIYEKMLDGASSDEKGKMIIKENCVQFLCDEEAMDYGIVVDYINVISCLFWNMNCENQPDDADRTGLKEFGNILTGKKDSTERIKSLNVLSDRSNNDNKKVLVSNGVNKGDQEIVQRRSFRKMVEKKAALSWEKAILYSLNKISQYNNTIKILVNTDDDFIHYAKKAHRVYANNVDINRIIAVADFTRLIDFGNDQGFIMTDKAFYSSFFASVVFYKEIKKIFKYDRYVVIERNGGEWIKIDKGKENERIFGFLYEISKCLDGRWTKK